MPLQIAHQTAGKRAVLAVDGELDLLTASDLTDAAMVAIDAGAHDVIIDAHALAFCDSSGLTALVKIANRLTTHSGHLAIAGPPPMVRRVLQISGLDEAFVVVDDVPDAMAALDS